MKLLLAAAFAIAAITPASAAIVIIAGPSQVFTVIEHATSDATASIGKAKDNRGDILTFANPIFNRTNQKQIGTDNGYCIRTVAGAAYECNWTVSLPNGQIMTEGPFHDSGDTTLAVIGGTGKYFGTRGEMVLHARNPKGTEYDFKYSLVK